MADANEKEVKANEKNENSESDETKCESDEAKCDPLQQAQLRDTARRFKTSSRSALAKSQNRLRKLMSTTEDIYAVKELCEEVEERWEDVQSALKGYTYWVSGEELAKEEEKHSEIEEEMRVLIEKVDQWIESHFKQRKSARETELGDESDMKAQLGLLQEKMTQLSSQVSSLNQQSKEPASQLRASAATFYPAEHMQSSNSPTQQAAPLGNPPQQTHPQNDGPSVHQMLAAMQLPQVELVKFRGDPTEYVNFIKSFEARVMQNTLSPSNRLFFLHQALDEEARELVSGCMYMGDDGFSEALRLLKVHYGQPHIICNSFMNQFQNFPSIKADDAGALKRLYLLSNKCLQAMKSLGDLSVLDFPANLQTLVLKFPPYLRNKWRDYASRENRRILFQDMVDFLGRASQAANDPLFSNQALFGNSAPKRKEEKTSSGCFSTQTTQKKTCSLCQQDHHLSACRLFKEKDFKEKQEFIFSKKLCFRCLNFGHRANTCRKKYTCSLCQGNHMNVMHKHKDKRETPSEQSSACQENENVLHAILPVEVTFQCRRAMTYAFYDHGSSTSFLTDSLKEKLGTDGPRVTLRLSTMHGSAPVDSTLVRNLVVTDLQGENAVTIEKLYTKEAIPVSDFHIPRPEHLNKEFGHLVPKYIENLEIGLLIGANCPRALEPLRVIRGSGNQAFAYKLRHGWVVNGPNKTTTPGLTAVCHRLQVQEVPVQEVLYHDDFGSPPSYPDERGLSLEDRRFLAQMERETKLKDGHYEIPLPLRNPQSKLPNNRVLALQRNRYLERKLSKDSEFKTEYVAFMNTLLEKGYAEKVPADQLRGEDGRLWYLPHHGVRHPKKKKLRIVFDCSAVYQGISLNSCLLQGPNLTSSLLGVLSRFRTEQTCFMADIEAMFFQVSVPERDRNFFRFLWWPNGDQSGALEEYRMKVHLFGAASSPSVCNYALRRIPDDFQCSDTVTETIRKHFYVDDCLKASTSAAEASAEIEDLRAACLKGGFRLRKFVANDIAVLDTIPSSEVAEKIKNLDLRKDPLPAERTLGLQWYTESDECGFCASEITKPATRRGLLSAISAIYDPLGIVSPFVLDAKLLLQRLCASKIEWDDDLPHSELQQWQKWLSVLPNIAKVRLKRCLFESQDHHSEEMHVFCDANMDGYGAVAYMGYKSENKIHCSFLMGKSRIKPLKAITIPRMELAAATVAIKMAATLCFEVGYDRTQVTYHTDSTSVLYFLNSQTKRFPIFVANRVHLIQEFSSAIQWRYVPSAKNPADIASRGLPFSKVDGNSTRIWLNGPEFLHQEERDGPKQDWNQQKDEEMKKNDDSEITCMTSAATIAGTETHQSMDALIEHYSDLMRLKKACSVYLTVMEILKAEKEKKKLKETNLNPFFVDHLNEAEKHIVRYVQNQCFSSEIESLCRNNKVATGSSIRKLSPFIDGGLLRVGGRLSNSSLPYQTRHPILLPRRHHLTELIIASHHQRLGHAGRNHVIASIREQYWIIAINAAVRKHIISCIVCRKNYRPCATQIMADLPQDRVEPAPPFTYTGVDLFGPFLIKERRSEVKRYGVLFTCLASRSIHIETANSLDINSFINPMRRMISRRGFVKQMRSDRGTNLVGTDRELKKAFKEMESSTRLKQECTDIGMQWTFNPPIGKPPRWSLGTPNQDRQEDIDWPSSEP